jgi:16S rRNA (adenine1518-N6/adenine1519-N6)-dimethyltransferase
MNLCDINVIKPLLQKHGFRFSKSKGQNFLTQSWVPREIAEAAGIDETCGVLEVGPGIGPLTQALCQSAAQVVSVEVDTSLAPILAETMGDAENFTLIFGDILKTDIPALVTEHFQGLRPMACANLPYYITSPVLSALLESRCFEAVTVMVQKEVAQRICAQPGTKDYSAFSLFCQYYAEPKILFDVPPSCFIPQPKVTSAVITLRCRTAPPCPIGDEKLFFRVVKASFAQRRKTLTNGLSSGFGELTKEQIIACLHAAGLSETVRGETLDIPTFARVADELAKCLPPRA